MSKTNSTYYNPWIDIASYQIDDAFRFKGREEDLEKFLRIIDNRTMSVLYANSGIGKTSFINAGIIPEMKSMGFLPIRVIIPDTLFESGDIAVWLYERFFSLKEENEGQEANTYYWKSHTDEIIDGSDTSLWWLLHTSRIHEHGTDKTYIPLIVFDQFEEVFIKSQKRGEKCGDFLEDFFGIIQDMASKVMPNYLRRKLEEKTNKEGRFISIGSAHEYKVIFSLRNEYLSDFDYWTNDKFIVTELYRNRMYLLPLTREQATRVITEQPTPKNEGECIDTLNDIKDDILNKINGKKNEIEPLMLSVLCSRLYDEAISRGGKHLTKQDVESINMDTLISKFYVDTVSSVITDPKLLSEFEEQMVDKDNHRNKVKSSLILGGEFEKEYEIKKDDKIIKTSYKKELEDKHVIRIERYNNEDYVELIHDRLVEVVRERNQHRKNREINMRRRLNRMNVLSPQGRRLIDNELEYDYSTTKYKTDMKWVLDDYVLQGRMLEKIAYDKRNKMDIDYDITELKSILETTHGGSSIRLGFVDKDNNSVVTNDGIDGLDVTFNEFGQITQIIFRETIQHANGTKSYEPFYLNGGYCGIQIDYNGTREKSRTYLQYDKGSFRPIQTVEGYATIEFEKYDDFGFPQKTVYKDVDNNCCMHRSGNHGFISQYDEDGYEILRIFIDNKGRFCELVSGICARQLDYDINSGFLKRETNLNKKLKPTFDKNGYCKVVFERDDWGRIIKESYYDNTNSSILCENGYAAEVTKYFDLPGEKHSHTWYVNTNGLLVQNKDGYWKARYDYDDNDYIVSMAFGCSKDNLNPEADDFVQREKTLLLYDKMRHIVGIKVYKRKDDYAYGYWLEYNREYSHVVRMGGLNKKGENDKIPSYDVDIIELRENTEDLSMPLLRVFLDGERKPIKCNDGYKALRRWTEKKKWMNDESRTVKELYYDEHGNIAYDISGICGTRIDYDEEHLTEKIYNLDANGNDCDDMNGICCTEVDFDDKGREIGRRWFASDYKRCPNQDGIWETKCQWSVDDMIETTINLNEKGVPSDKEIGYAYCIREKDKNFHELDKRIYYLDKNEKNVIFDGICILEYLYDGYGKLFGIQNVDSNGNLLMTNDGYAVMKTELSEDGFVSRTMYYDEKNKPVSPEKEGYFMSEVHYDDKGRDVKLLRFNEKHERITFGGDICGIGFEYGDGINSTKTIFLDEHDEVATSSAGFAMLLTERDVRGRKTKEIHYDAKGNPLLSTDGDYGKKWEYIDLPDKITEIEISIDQFETPMVNQNGYSVCETVFDENRNPVKTAVFDTGRRPIVTERGFHSVITNTKYNQSGLKIVTISFMNIYNEPCEDSMGIAKIVRQYDSFDNLVEEYQQNLQNELIPFNNGVYVKKRRYKRNNVFEEFYYNKQRSLMEDKDGVAMRYIEEDDKGRNTKIINFNSDQNIIMDELGDYGESILYLDDGNKILIGLDKDGNPHENLHGFCAQRISVNEQGDITLRLFLDKDGNLTENIEGFFGVKTEYLSNNTTITTTLDYNQAPFAPRGRGYAIEEKTISDNGRVIHFFWRDRDGQPYVDEDGDSGLNIIYGDDYETREFLNKNGHPHINMKGRAKTVVYSKDGYYREIWYDVDNSPIANNNGDYGMMVLSNNAENSHTISHLDSEGNPHRNKEGWTYKKIYEHENSDIIEVFYFDGEMQPWEDSDGDVAYRRIVSDAGDIIFISLDTDGRPHTNKNGYAIRRVKLDNKERVIKELWFDINQIPVCNDKGDYGLETEYDDLNSQRTRKSLDINGVPQKNSLGYSMCQQTFNEDGQIVQEMWLDEDGAPIKDKDSGCCGLRRYFFDDQNMEIRINLDSHERPCEDKFGISSVKIWKDDKGRRIQEMNYNIFGIPVCDKYGDCGTRYLYTDDPYIAILISLNSNGEPHINRYGYTKEIRIIKENELTSVYLDEKDKPVNRQESDSATNSNDKDMSIVPEVVLFQAEQDGQLKDKHLYGQYVLLRYNKWQLGLPLEALNVEIDKARDKEKQMLFIECKGGVHSNYGQPISTTFKGGLLGGRFQSESVSNEVYQNIICVFKEYCNDNE